jgi:esterase/lipase superfamily enzyme
MHELAHLEYLTEYPIGKLSGPQRRHVRLHRTTTHSDILGGLSSTFAYRSAQVLEGRTMPDNDGVWPISAHRVGRRIGTPIVAMFQRNMVPEDATNETLECAKQNRLQHYCRVTSTSEVVRCLRLGIPVSFSLEVTPEWYDPPRGLIEIQSPELDIRGAHCVSLTKHIERDSRKLFAFPNSWGESWGDHGWGYIPCEEFDRLIIEAWRVGCPGYVAPLLHHEGIVCLEWKWSLTDKIDVHGREIVDAELHERLAWAFCVRRDSYLDVDEFFVWPTNRGRGYARCLASMVKSLSAVLRCPIRTWVSFADTEQPDYPGAKAVARLLGVQLGESPVRWAHLCGTDKPLPVDPKRRRPARPSSILEYLRPKDETATETPVEYDVFFGTNRARTGIPQSIGGLSNQRGDCLSVGRCRVNIPTTHRFGGKGKKWLAILPRSTFSDFVVLATEVLDVADFLASIGVSGNDHDCDPQNLLYIHGYRTSFEDAIKGAAQLGVDLKIPGQTFVYSWPSLATTGGYAADAATIEASIPYVEQFIRMIRDKSVGTPLNIIVHSMGSRAIVRLLERMARDTASSHIAPIGQVIFAAPDVDLEVFTNGAAAFAQVARRTTLYATRADLALQASEFLYRFPRAGLVPPIPTVDGIDTVLVEDFDLLSLGHGYCRDASAVLHDMFHLIRHNSPPRERPAVHESRSEQGKTYWRLSVA